MSGGGDDFISSDGWWSMVDGYREKTSLENAWLALSINVVLMLSGVWLAKATGGWLQWAGILWAVINAYGAVSVAARMEVGD